MRFNGTKVTEKSENKAKKGTKKPKKVTAGYLERAALHYLGRFSSSEKNLQDVLVRKVRRRNESFAAPTDEQLGWINDVVRKCIRYGYINDRSYAEQRAQLMLRRGKPSRSIAQDLRHKGIAGETIEAVLNQLAEEHDVDSDRMAAANYVRRRRFGPFRRDLADAEAVQAKLEKEIAAMARAGFGYSMAKELLEMDEEELMALLG